jgi:hypothetical protein
MRFRNWPVVNLYLQRKKGRKEERKIDRWKKGRKERKIDR